MCSLKTSLGSLSPKSWFVQTVVVLVHVVDPLEEVGHPADAALGEGDRQVGELAQHGRPQEVGRALHDVHRLQRDHRVDRCVAATGGSRRRADVEADHRAGLVAGRPERVPVVVWKLGRPSFSGFSEKVTAWQPLSAAPAPRRPSPRVPDGGPGRAGSSARVGAAPVVEVPVVVRLQQLEGDVLVVARQEQWPRTRPGSGS